jgi:hypothetical protein
MHHTPDPLLRLPMLPAIRAAALAAAVDMAADASTAIPGLLLHHVRTAPAQVLDCRHFMSAAA